MVDKKSSKQPDTIPKKPPKRPSRDYSALPQRPIALKQLGKKSAATTGKKSSIKSKPGIKQKKKPMPKRSPPRVKKQPPDQWLLKGISDEAREYAEKEASRQGLTIGEWIEQLILSNRQPAGGGRRTPAEPETPQTREEITETLHAIEQRLDRMEGRRGFWSRFWDQVMQQAERQRDR